MSALPDTDVAPSPADIAAGILEGWRAFLNREEGRTPSSAPNVYASQYHECTRHMALNLVAGDHAPAWEAEQLANFRRGKDRERNLLADLSLIGRDSRPAFELVGGQERFVLRDRKGRVVITGKVDARVQVGRRKFPLEAKSWAANTVSRIHCFEDLLDNRWTRSGAHQLLSYLYASNEESGFLLLDRHGLPLLLPVVLNDDNLERMEQFLQKSETAMDARERIEAAGGFLEAPAELLPAFHSDPAVCRSCKYFGRACNPPIGYESASVITDPEVVEAIETSLQLKPAHEQYETAWNLVKERLRGVEQAIAPNALIEGRWQKKTSYDVPDVIRAPYKRVDPKGKFVLEVTPLSVDAVLP